MSSAHDHDDDDDEDYVVKFVDIRVKPPGGKRGKAKTHICEHKGCDAVGDCKAPKPYMAREVPVPGQKTKPVDHYWFCKRHAAEYNKKYDFFDGMTEGEIMAFRNNAPYGHQKTWKMGTGPVGGAKASASTSPNRWRGRSWILDENGPSQNRNEEPERRLTRLQVKALQEMSLGKDAKPAQVREQYALLIKRYHPDSNGGDRSMEQRLNVVIKAFKALKSTGLA